MNGSGATEFRYWTPESWAPYFAEVSHLAALIREIVGAAQTLKAQYHDRLFDENDSLLCAAVLGGLDGHGKHLDGSFAAVCQSLWGIRGRYIHDYLAAKELGMNKGLVLEVSQGSFGFLAGLSHLSTAVETVLRLARAEGLFGGNTCESRPVEAADMLDPTLVARLLSELVEGLVNILPNRSPAAFWVWSMDCITQGYMLRAYPELAGDVPIKRTTLMPQPFFRLSTNHLSAADRKTLESYTVFRYQDLENVSQSRNVGAALIRLYVESWRAFRCTWKATLKLVFQTPPDPVDDFLAVALLSLDEIGWNKPQIRLQRGNDTRRYHFEGLAFTGGSWSYVSRRGNRNSGGWGPDDWQHDEKRWTIPELLDALSPGTFLLNGLDFVEQGFTLCLPRTENLHLRPASGGWSTGENILWIQGY